MWLITDGEEEITVEKGIQNVKSSGHSRHSCDSSFMPTADNLNHSNGTAKTELEFV